MEKKTILMVHNYYQIGGGEHTVFENEVALLRKNGHNVITYTRSNDELKAAKWKLLLVPFATLWSFKTYREVRALIRNEGIDIVHCHNTFPLISPSVYYAARSLRIPVLQTIHNFRLLCPNGLFFCEGQVCEDCRQDGSFSKALKNGCYRNSRVQTLPVVLMLQLHRLIGTYQRISYIFLTDFNRRKFDHLIDIDSCHVYIKPNFVPDAPVLPRRDIQKVFVFAGRLDEYKGLRFILKAWESLPKDYILHIYGDGALRPLVEEYATRMPNIRYFGFQPRAVLAQELSACTACLLPSLLYEGFPMSMAESFQAGCPVVTGNIGNPRNLVEASQAGVTFRLDDPSSVRAALDDVIINNKQYSRMALAYYQEHLSEQKNYQRIEEIYRQAEHISHAPK